MIEPVAQQDFLASFLSAAMVILCGAGYAVLFAWSKLRRRPTLMLWAYACYMLLAVSVTTLASTANLDGPWRTLPLLMLIGYLLAPHGIWRLCVDTHADERDANES